MDNPINDWGLSKIKARKKQPKISKKDACEFLPELKKQWHQLGQLHLRLNNGIERNQPIYMTKPEAYEALKDVIERLNNICENYLK